MTNTTTYQLNADGTIKTITTKNDSFKERLEKKYQTPNADKILRENPESNNFDSHKFLK